MEKHKKGTHPLYLPLKNIEVGQTYSCEYHESYISYTHYRGRLISKRFKTFRDNDGKRLNIIRIA
jgi:hypothetical protein